MPSVASAGAFLLGRCWNCLVPYSAVEVREREIGFLLGEHVSVRSQSQFAIGVPVRRRDMAPVDRGWEVLNLQTRRRPLRCRVPADTHSVRSKAALKGMVVTSVEADASDHLAAAAAGHPRGSTQRPLENLLKGTQPRKNKKKQLKIFVRWALIIAGAAAGAVTLAIFVGLVATLVGDGAIPSDQLFAQSSPAVVRVLVKDGKMQTTGQGWGFSYRQMVCSSPTSM